jgi:hypothetical protein
VGDFDSAIFIASESVMPFCAVHGIEMYIEKNRKKMHFQAPDI